MSSGIYDGPKKTDKMKYTTRQVIAMTTSVFIFMMILFPPTDTLVNTIDGPHKVFSGYRFIGSLESYQRNNQMSSLLNRSIQKSVSIYSIETTRLYAQLISLLTISVLLMWSFESKKKKHS